MLTRVFTLLLLVTIHAQAFHKGMLNFSALDAELSIDFDLAQFQDEVSLNSYYLGFDSVLTNDGKGIWFTSVDFMFVNEVPEISGLKVGAGIRALFTHYNLYRFLAFPLGVQLEYRVPNKNQLPFFVTSEFHYATKTLSFMDADTYLEFRAGASYEVIEHLKAFCGWRIMQTNYNAVAITYNNAFYLGLEAGF